MKKAVLFMTLIIALLSLNPVFGQKPQAPDIWPGYWYGNEEFIYHTLPVGGWNTLGSFSLRGVAMGETFLSSSDGTSGYLNPAFLSVIEQPQFSFNYRYSENSYKMSAWPDIIPMRGAFHGYGETRSFRRKTDSVDSISLALPFGDWAVAANYFLFQDFSFPKIDGALWNGLDSIKQSGAMRGVNLALVTRLTSSFSLGISASYVFGDIRRTQVLVPVYIIYDDPAPPTDPGGTVPYYWPWPSTSEEYHLDLKGLYFNLGATFEPNAKWKFGLALRPPFAVDIKARIESTYLDGLSATQTSWGDFYGKQPFVAVGSVLYKPVDRFELTADVSVWGWSGVSSDYAPSSYYPQDLKNIIKLNLGAEYRIPLPFPAIKDLYLRAGYIHDPQPYRYAESYSRDYLCAGTGLCLGHLVMGFSAKIALSPREPRRFHSNVFQAGATYRF